LNRYIYLSHRSKLYLLDFALILYHTRIQFHLLIIPLLLHLLLEFPEVLHTGPDGLYLLQVVLRLILEGDLAHLGLAKVDGISFGDRDDSNQLLDDPLTHLVHYQLLPGVEVAVALVPSEKHLFLR